MTYRYFQLVTRSLFYFPLMEWSIFHFNSYARCYGWCGRRLLFHPISFAEENSLVYKCERSWKKLTVLDRSTGENGGDKRFVPFQASEASRTVIWLSVQLFLISNRNRGHDLWQIPRISSTSFVWEDDIVSNECLSRLIKPPQMGRAMEC